ncbi:PAS domain S-box protein [Cupriavidus sp. AU9028]|uniref:PAS domain S-box protein n=1 Tax=Cupriavidus sp. AU9028 TaxID=2871157 RepID=UPI001C982D9E|nr:PAS domain S-box protein [Cupriavidus sp. AU9028]MBY4897209.1 PAS domain S-box protein [Cupriavidus sp. AU9028]
MTIEIGTTLTDFADHMLDAVFLVDTRGTIQYVSPATEGILGFSQRDMTGLAIMELVLPEDRDRTRAEAGHVMAGQRRFGFENRYLHKSGEAVHILWSAGWLEVERLRVGVARDISALRRPASLLARGMALASAPLAPHEQKVLQQLLTDASEKQIAQRLGLAVSTTHSYVTGIYRKFGVRSRAGLMSLWLNHVPPR